MKVIDEKDFDDKEAERLKAMIQSLPQHKIGSACVLYDGKKCDNCHECDMCDLDSSKICDNCGKCVDSFQTDDKGFVNFQATLTKELPNDSKLDDLLDSYGLNDDGGDD